MAGFGAAALRFRGGALFVWGVWLLAACSSSVNDGARAAPGEQNVNVPCGQDEVREYFCDDLLPLSSSRPAPEPYDTCPAATDIRHGAFPAVGHVALFDESFTAYTRQRVQPGHSCCYGWCAKVKVADPGQAAPVACRDSSGFHESVCMRELEGGTSVPSGEPFERCPQAIQPPEVLAFAAPSSALLDLTQTNQRRRDLRLADCCYGWCSKAPVGTVQKSRHPKTK